MAFETELAGLFDEKALFQILWCGFGEPPSLFNCLDCEDSILTAAEFSDFFAQKSQIGELQMLMFGGVGKS